MEQHDVALLDLDALLGERVVDLLLVEGRSGRHGFLPATAVMSSTTPRVTNARQLLDTELLETVGRGEVHGLVAVVVDVIDADVAEAVELRADADPAGDDVVVVGGLGRAEAVPPVWPG